MGNYSPSPGIVDDDAVVDGEVVRGETGDVPGSDLDGFS